MTDQQTSEVTQAVGAAAEVAAFAISGPQLAALVSAAAQLVLEVEAIRANAVAAWGQVETDYTGAVEAWNAATATPVAAAAIANASGHFNDARASGQTPVASSVPVDDGSGLSSAPAVTVSLSSGVQQVGDA